MEEFCKVFFRPKKTLTKQDHGKLNAIIDPAVQRFRKLDDETQQEFWDAAGAFRRLYAFLAQIIPFQDSDLDKLYTYIRFILNKLTRPDYGPEYYFIKCGYALLSSGKSKEVSS